MFEQMLQQFLGSSQGQAAMQTLQQQHGMAPGVAQQALGVAGEGAAQVLQQQQGNAGAPGGAQGFLGGGLTANAITGALSGMLGGGGLGGALEGGLSGVVAGKVGEMLASRMGMNPQTASLIAAGIAPHLVNFIQARMGTQNHTGAGPGALPIAPPPLPPMQQGAAASMQPMGGPQWAPPATKGGGATGKFDPSTANPKDPYGQSNFDPGMKGAQGDGGYAKPGFDPSQDGQKDQTPAWKKG
ncbi:MAG: hypothetical protein JWM10_491 [Myxococcaceae bacterium]|nr:hypothetical protein [Myxococcaceae bacterium]